jgi:glycosyltransferase involved in cell wall biosynthesis
MITIVHPLLCYYPSQAGGPANTLYWINSSLGRDKFKSFVVATTLGIPQPLAKKDPVSNSEAFFYKSKGFPYIKKSLELLAQASIVQFSSLFFPPTLPLLIAGLINRKTIVISPRGELYPSALAIKPFKKKLWIRLITQFQKHIYFHATNDLEQSIIWQHFPKAKCVDVIPNYLLLPPKLDEKVLSRFVFLGRINPIKNIDVLLRAVAEMKEASKHKDIEIIIMGSARLPYEIEYEKKIHALTKSLDLINNIKFMGHMEGHEKNKIIATSMALVLPSKSENFGNVVLEALAQGTPVIASKNTPWEVLESLKAGLWVDPEVHALSQALTAILDLKQEDYQAMRKNAYSLCKSTFDIKSNINVWENYYKKITADV